jgi:putative SOS response-associated peptidase YedK
MCGRYTNTAGPEELGETFRIRLDDPRGTGRYNIAPTQEVLVVRAAEGQRLPELMRWGLLPPWAVHASRRYNLINIRQETALAKPTFSNLLRNPERRCLQLADGWYEWLAAERRGLPRQPFRLTVDGGKPFAFAAVWTQARLPEGREIRSVALLTRQAVGKAAELHRRMPVVLADPDLQEAWLGEQLSAAELLELCTPPAAERISVAPANPALNRPDAPEGPHLLEA